MVHYQIRGGKMMQGYLFGRPVSEDMVLQYHAKPERSSSYAHKLLDVAS